MNYRVEKWKKREQRDKFNNLQGTWLSDFAIKYK